jgi:hypothetical protein
MAATNGAVLLAGPAFAAVLAGAYGTARLIFGRMSRNRERALRTVVEHVAQRVQECIAARQGLPEGDPRRLGR